jgi:hypothetical protein
MRKATRATVFTPNGHATCNLADLPATIELQPGQLLILLCE